MASVRQKPNGKWLVEIRKSGHKPISRVFPAKRDAQHWALETELKLEHGQSVHSHRKTLAQAIDFYLAEHPNLATNQTNMLQWWRLEIGSRRLLSLRKSDFVEARQKLKSLTGKSGVPLKGATINRRLSAVSAAITYAMDELEWIATNPARIRRLPENNERDRLLEQAELVRLLEACRRSDEPYLFAFVVCAMLSGARAGELRNLRWKDVDLEVGVGRLIKTKSGVRRAIPLGGQALAELTKLMRLRPVVHLDGSDHVFLNRKQSGPINYQRAWIEAKSVARIENLRFHDLRHWSASHLAMQGASLRELAEVLGHSSMQMVKRYSHFPDSHLVGKSELLSAIAFGKEN